MGDGVFKWYWAVGTTMPEVYQGRCDTRDQAVAEAKSSDGDLYGFIIVEADRSVPKCDIFDYGDIFDRFCDRNEECWGEDGMELDYKPDQARDLEKMLTAAFEAWFVKHGIKREGFNLDEMRNEETFAGKEAAE